MLFEQNTLTPQGRLVAIEQLFEQLAQREGTPPDAGHVPVAVLEAYGAFETPVRHMLEAAFTHTKDRTTLSRLRKIERALNTLPEALMTTLRTGANGNWLVFYRRLIELHGLMTDAETEPDAEEYGAMLHRMAVLAGLVSRHSCVTMEAEQAFTLLLMQIELRRQQHPKRPRKRARKKRRSTKKKASTAAKTKE